MSAMFVGEGCFPCVPPSSSVVVGFFESSLDVVSSGPSPLLGDPATPFLLRFRGRRFPTDDDSNENKCDIADHVDLTSANSFLANSTTRCGGGGVTGRFGSDGARSGDLGWPRGFFLRGDRNMVGPCFSSMVVLLVESDPFVLVLLCL
jgi:hypothetical protein